MSAQLTIPTTGKVTNIAVHNNLLVWAADEPLSAEKPEVTVGTVYLCNVNDQKPIPVHRSEDMPYTHSFGEIRSIALLFIDEGNFIVTGGGEGVVRTWKFDPTKNKFEQLNVLEGHVRGVTCVLLNGELPSLLALSSLVSSFPSQTICCGPARWTKPFESGTWPRGGVLECYLRLLVAKGTHPRSLALRNSSRGLSKNCSSPQEAPTTR